MNALLTEPFLVSLLYGAVTAGVPLLLAGLGEQMSEKAGVLNVGIEGMMLFGAYAGFVAAWYTGSFWLGFLSGGLGGAAVAFVVLLLCIRRGLNQIVIGIAVTMGCQGLTALLHFVAVQPDLSAPCRGTRARAALFEPHSHPRQGTLQPQPDRILERPFGVRSDLGVPRHLLRAEPRGRGQ